MTEKTKVIELAIERQYPHMKLAQFPDLPLQNFNDLIANIDNHRIELAIDDIKSLGFIWGIGLQPAKKIINIGAYIPYLLGLAPSIWGLWVGNYWLLLCIPAAYLGVVRGRTNNKTFINWAIGLVCVYEALTGGGAVMIISAAFSLSWAIFQALRMYASSIAQQLAKSSENIFCYLFRMNFVHLTQDGKILKHSLKATDVA